MFILFSCKITDLALTAYLKIAFFAFFSCRLSSVAVFYSLALRGATIYSNYK